MRKDLSDIKHYLSPEIYNRYNYLIEIYKEEKKTRIFEEMNVKSSAIRNVYYKDNCVNIEVILTSRCIDYFIDEDGFYLSGDKHTRIIKNIYITLSKKADAKELGEARRCPNCGKTLDINKSGECPYCGMIIDMRDYDYVITSLEVK